MALTGGSLPLASGVSIVRYPIPERIFDYVSTVRSATAGTCQKTTIVDANGSPPKPSADRKNAPPRII
jgi:hypothetical protein